MPNEREVPQIERWVSLYTHDRCWNVMEGDESRIDAAVTRYVETSGAQDTLLDLTATHGVTVRLLASECVAWEVSTPSSRFAEVVLAKREDDESREHQKAAGYKDDTTEAWKEA